MRRGHSVWAEKQFDCKVDCTYLTKMKTSTGQFLVWLQFGMAPCSQTRKVNILNLAKFPVLGSHGLKLFSRQYGSGPSRFWQGDGLDILPEAPIGEPHVAPLKELGFDDLKSLEFLRDKLQETLPEDATKKDVLEYWNSQLHFQENISPDQLVELPFSFPGPATYVPPATITVQEALDQAHPRLRALVNPVPRPTYLGSRNPTTRAAVDTMEDDRFAQAMETIEDFDPKQHGNQLVISWANGEAFDTCWFVVKCKHQGQPIVSPPLHLAKVEEIDSIRNTVT